MAISSDTVREVFVAGLRDAHAVEHQALALMDRQIDHLARYPEIETRLRAHRIETEHQIARLDEILEGMGESRSMLKDAALSVSGNLAAIVHMFAPDEILKNSFANFAFENFEAAAYKGLIAMAEVGSFTTAIPHLTQTLREEQSMAQFCDEILPAVTRRYLDLRAAGETASH